MSTAKTRIHRTRVLEKCHLSQKGTGRAPEEKWTLEIDGQMLVYTSCPKSREIGKGLLGKIQKQLHLNDKEYVELYSCRYKYEDYIRILTKKQILQPPPAPKRPPTDSPSVRPKPK